MQKLLSVVSPMYNNEKHIRATLDSIFDSVSGKNFELVEFVFVNDGSIDATQDILEEYQKKYDFRIIKQTNQGCTASSNTLIKEATGEFIYMIDHDDLLMPHAIDKIIDYLQGHHNIDLLVFDNDELTKYPDGSTKLRYKTRGWNFGSLTGQEVFAQLLKKMMYTAALWYRVMRRQKLIENNILFREDMLWGDLEFTPRMYAVMDKVGYIPEALYRYLIFADSLSQSTYRNAKYTMLCMQAIDSLSDFIRENKNLSDCYVKALHNSMGNSYWDAIDGIKPNGEFDNKAILELQKRKQFLKYGKPNRKYIYRWLVYLFGIKGYYNFRYRK